MMSNGNDFIPVILGTDITAYSMARAFYEEYGVTSYCIARERIGSTDNSKFVDVHTNPRLFESAVLLEELTKAAGELSASGKKLVLIGGNDTYARMVCENREYLSQHFVVPYINSDLMRQLVNKDSFYELCGKHGLDYPGTYVYRKGEEIDNPFPYPVVVKPAFSSDYWTHPFPGMFKAYRVYNDQQLKETISQMYSGGYSSPILVQDLIPGDDASMRVLTCYSDSSGTVKLMSFGQIVLSEHTPHGIGNYAAIISGYNEEIMAKVESFLNAIGYTGISNFDIKYDCRDHKYKFFEINIRQGRSNYYVTGSGGNLAKCIVDDYIHHRELEHRYLNEEYYFHVIPNSLVLRYVKDAELQNKIRSLIRSGKELRPLYCKSDNSYRRALYLFLSAMRYHQKYRQSPPIPEDITSPALFESTAPMGM